MNTPLLSASGPQAFSTTPPAAPVADQSGWLLTYLDVFILTTALFATLYLAQPEAPHERPLAPPAAAEVHPVEAEPALIPAATVAVSQPVMEAEPTTEPIAAAAPAAAPAPPPAAAVESMATPPPVAAAQERSARLELPEGMEFAEEPGQTRLRIGDSLLFAAGQAHLLSEGETFLALVLPVIREGDGEVIIEGHTDSVPIRTTDYASNWELSSARAQHVLHFLIALGVQEHRLRTMAFADTRPLASNRTEDGRARNRRVEIVLVHPES